MFRKIFLSSASLLSLAASLAAANPIPHDPAVRVGSLPNGLTYYIRHNDSPQGQADFFIAGRAGSVQEEDGQEGLAHFLEHMCFNGTKHFPGNSLVSWLESIGVRFGKNLNAYTAADETVYNICAVPVARDSALDSCVMVLADWSGRLLLEKDAVDAERGVIRGEMRQRSTPNSRIMEKILPQVFGDSPYANRLPIGRADVIDSFDVDTLRAYYHRWHVPSNQAVVIVGDIDVDRMEEAVKRHFADIVASPGAKVAERPSVEFNKEPLYALGSDPEQARTMVQVFFREPQLPVSEVGTIEQLRRDYIRNLIIDMVVERMDALESSGKASWADMGIGAGHLMLAGGCDAIMLRAFADNADDTRKTLSAVYTEMLRAAVHGFSPAEFERAVLTEKAKRDRMLAAEGAESNTELARRYVASFTKGDLIPSTRQYCTMMKGVAANTSLECVNEYMAAVVHPAGAGRVVCVYAAPADSASLSEEILRMDALAIDVDGLAPYVDSFKAAPLLTREPSPGSIVKEEDAPFGASLLSLSNGIKVWLRPVADNSGRVSVLGVSPGGFSMNYDPAGKGLYKMANEVMASMAFGGKSSSDIGKSLAGKDVEVALKISNTTEEVAAVCAAKDFEEAMRLLYLKTTAPEADSITFSTALASARARLGRVATPVQEMGDSIHEYVFRRHPFGAKLRLADLDALSAGDIVALHKERYGDMSDFSFIITGDFTPDSIRHAIETYIAALPAEGRIEKPQDTGYGYWSGSDEFSFKRHMPDNPQSILYTFFTGEAPYDLENVLLSSAFGSILKARLLARLREELSLTYGVTTHCSVTAGYNGDWSPSVFILPVYVKCEPGREKEALAEIDGIIDSLVTEGPDTAEVEKVKAFMLKEIADNRTSPAYWQTVLKVYSQFGKDMDSRYEEIVGSLTPAALRDFAAAHLPVASRLRLSLTPDNSPGI